MNKIISVIIPYYNSENYIVNCVNSVLQQTYTKFEIIIVNDGSNEQSSRFLIEQFKDYCNIKIIHKKNGGVSSARNKGLEYAIGDFISFVDSDDTIENTMFEDLLRHFSEDIDIVCCETNRVNNNGEVILKNKNYKNQIFTALEAIKSCLEEQEIKFAVYDKIYRKTLFEKNNIFFPEGKTMEEAAVLPYLFLNSRKIKYISEYKYNYYVRPNSYTTKLLSEECYCIFDTIEEYRKNIIKLFPNIDKEIDYYERKTIIPLYRTALLQKKLIKKEVYLRIKKEFNKVLIPTLVDKRFNIKFKVMTIETMMGMHLLRRKYREKK